MRTGRLVRHKNFNWIGLVLSQQFKETIKIKVRFILPDSEVFYGSKFYTILMPEKYVEYIDDTR